MIISYTDLLGDGERHEVAATVTTDHPASSYGQPVIVLGDGDTLDVASWVLLGYRIEQATADEIDMLRRIPFFNPPGAAAALGRLGGSKTSERKAAASRANGRRGGRPHALPLRYEVIEDNAGGLYIAILNRRGRCIGLFASFEYQPPDALISCIDALDDGSDFDDWEGAIPNPTPEYNHMMAQQPYGYQIICANYGNGRKIYPERMGRNGQIAFGVDD